MDVLVGNSDGWVRREAYVSDDSLPLYLQESKGDEHLRELLSVAVLNLGGQPVVRATAMEYFPETYIGGEIRYAATGEPETAGLTVELDFDQTQLHCPPKRVTRNYGRENDGEYGDGDRDRIRFPKSWTSQADKVNFEVDVRTKDGEWVRRNLTFPARMTVEMLKNVGIKKLTETAEI